MNHIRFATLTDQKTPSSRVRTTQSLVTKAPFGTSSFPGFLGIPNSKNIHQSCLIESISFQYRLKIVPQGS